MIHEICSKFYYIINVLYSHTTHSYPNCHNDSNGSKNFGVLEMAIVRFLEIILPWRILYIVNNIILSWSSSDRQSSNLKLAEWPKIAVISSPPSVN